MEARGTIHRAAAIALMALVAWHFVYVVFTERGHRQLMAMKVHASDFGAFFRLLGYYLGRRAELPAFGRFTPMQKLQYWGAGIGSLMMVATGLVLWFHTAALMVVPKWVLAVTTILHGYEGLILFALLFGWHIYIVHLSPGNFPMKRTFLTGRIGLERLRTEHALEYREPSASRAPSPAGRRRSRPSWTPAARTRPRCPSRRLHGRSLSARGASVGVTCSRAISPRSRPARSPAST